MWEFLGFESEREDSICWSNNKMVYPHDIMYLKLTWQNGLDAIEDERDGKQRAEICHCIWDHLTLREQVADVVAQAEDDNAKDDAD